MSLSCGVVGLPNVGKSTLFNILTLSEQAAAANYPFCTIEPNTGQVVVPDPRLHQLAQYETSKKIIPTTLTLVDIAGLVKGASQGEGLGNQFLSHIRQVDVIVHVLRAFQNKDITHVDGSVDPLRDREVIETELLLADLHMLQTWKASKKPSPFHSIIDKSIRALEQGTLLSKLTWSLDEKECLKKSGLITAKPMVYVCNTDSSQDTLDLPGSVIYLCAQLESDMITWSPQERQDFLNEAGWHQTGLEKLITTCHQALDLITFFTIGPKEARAWSTPRGSLAPQAARHIHTDFEKHFIRAEVITFEDYTLCQSAARAKIEGKMQLRGKDYTVQDGDTLHILSSA